MAARLMLFTALATLPLATAARSPLAGYGMLGFIDALSINCTKHFAIKFDPDKFLTQYVRSNNYPPVNDPKEVVAKARKEIETVAAYKIEYQEAFARIQARFDKPSPSLGMDNLETTCRAVEVDANKPEK